MTVPLDPWLETLRSLGTTERAENEKRYLKSALQHFGVPVPQLRKVARRFCTAHPDLDARALRDVTERAWATGIYEPRSFAVFVMERRRAAFGLDDLPFFERTLRVCRTWALLDTLCIGVIGDVVRRHPDATKALATWAVDDDFWLRRASLLSLLGAWRSGGDFDTASFRAFAVPMLDEREFFIRKAIGWVLRDVSKKEPDFPSAFLLEHRDRVSRLTLEEGAKYLPAETRQALGR